jgi:hypothetical protein
MVTAEKLAQTPPCTRMAEDVSSRVAINRRLGGSTFLLSELVELRGNSLPGDEAVLLR